MRATVADAWSLAPIGELRLGERVFPVPPLTFGRFQRLLGADPQKIAAALSQGTTRRSVPERLLGRALRWSILYAPRLTRHLWRIVDAFGLGKRCGSVPDAAPIVSICVPGVSETDWRAHGSPMDIARLFLMFGRGHDWALIAEAIRFGEPPEPGEVAPTLSSMAAGLIAVGKATGYTVEELTEMRVDGFYLLVDAIRDQRAAEPAADMPLGIEYSDQTGGSDLLARLKEAEEAARG